MRILAVINPASCRGDTGGRVEQVIDTLASSPLDVESVVTERSGHAEEVLRERGNDFQGVIAVGGDGTLHEVIQGLNLSRHRLGIVPRGSGNDWAWANGWPSDLEDCIERVARGREKSVDIGEWDVGSRVTRRFHNGVGCGFEAAVNRESQSIRWLRGRSIYLAASLRCLARRPRYHVRLEWPERGNGSLHHWEGDVLNLSIGNGARLGGGFLMVPEARVDDGLLDLCRISTVGFFRSLRLLKRTLRGTHVGDPAVHTWQASALRIQAPDGLPAHIDGEFIGESLQEISLRLRPGALKTF